MTIGPVAEGRHQRAAGDPPEHDAGAAERGGGDVHVGAAQAALEAAVLRLLQGRGRRARGAEPLQPAAAQERRRLNDITVRVAF